MAKSNGEAPLRQCGINLPVFLGALAPCNKSSSGRVTSAILTVPVPNVVPSFSQHGIVFRQAADEKMLAANRKQSGGISEGFSVAGVPCIVSTGCLG
jgi:hypothetical protein